MRAKQQAIAFIEFLLSHVETVEFAAAEYGAAGRVTRVVEARARVRAPSDFERIAAWLWARNHAGANIWSRPADPDHPLIMLDDLLVERARAICRKYRAAVVETSPENAQVWIACGRLLSREERQDVARSLCRLVGSDPGAISEPRWGRLPGYPQRKPGKGGWTNLISISEASLLDPTPHLAAASLPPPPRERGGGGALALARPTSRRAGADESVREFAFACHALRRGMRLDEVEALIQAHVAATGRKKSAGYAARTVARARACVGVA